MIYLLFDIIYGIFSLTGGTDEIDAADKTLQRGAVIASTHSAGSGQAGELRLDTGSFEYSHIKDREYSYSAGGGVNIGVFSDEEITEINRVLRGMLQL